MVSKALVIVNEKGIDIASAQILVNAMSKYSSSVILKVKDREINAKSIISLMIAKIKSGAELTLECNGRDEEEALKEAADLIENGFVKE